MKVIAIKGPRAISEQELAEIQASLMKNLKENVAAVAGRVPGSPLLDCEM